MGYVLSGGLAQDFLSVFLLHGCSRHGLVYDRFKFAKQALAALP
jgi:hypothetical protein